MVSVVQVGLLLLLFVFTASHYSTADFDDTESEHYVKKRVFMFSLIVSTVMFISALLTITLAGMILLWQQAAGGRPAVAGGREALPAARSLLPLGLANALLGLYIGIPGDDSTVVGADVFLLELCLYIGTTTILRTELESVGRIALLAAMWDGVVDPSEVDLLRGVNLARYAMALLQLVMFAVMLGHCVQVYAGGDRPELRCPRNLLLTGINI